MRRAVVVVLLVVAGCSAAPDDAPAPSSVPSPAPSRTTSAAAAPTPTPTPTPTPAPPGPVTIAVAGDVHFEGALRARLDDPATALAPVTRDLAAADVAIVNLETSLGRGGAPDPSKRYTFQAPPAALDALAAAGIDVAAMANNHALDFGRAPLPGAFRAIDAARDADPPLAVVGLGRDVAEAFAPAELDVGGTTVAVLAATRADLDPTADPTGDFAATAEVPGTADAVGPAGTRRLLRAVEDAARDADVVVAHLHWGVQGERCPTDDQQALAADLVEAGADVVVGSHAHLLQGDGRLGPGYVAYGLGNYAWYTQSGATASTGVLTLDVRPAATPRGRARVTDARWSPALIGADGLPRPVPDRSAFDATRAELRACAGLR